MLRNNIKKLLNVHNNNNYLPEFFRLRNHDDKQRFEKLLGDISCLVVYDEIVGQVEELIKCQNPKRVFSKEELHAAALQLVNDEGNEEFGVWVYYPWSNRLVHLLDEKDFVEVRTNRNQYKITKQEQEVLSSKRVGVIGLSVGQSVAVTLAQERGFGELRIADFDMLELSNYNRIRIGLHNLGLNKAISVAREIMEIDPFLKITPFIHGITEENIDDFIFTGGKLDLLIDECDGLDVKVLCRTKAKAYQIPVLMEASDRGTIDVERFDLEPDRPILHGFIEHLDVSKVKYLKTNEEKIPYLLPIAGLETLSKRAKASMIEVGQTITTWPQLASAVTLGGGITADISRRIFLNQYKDSGRYFVDIEELVSNKEEKNLSDNEIVFKEDIDESEMDVIISSLTLDSITNETELSIEVVKELVGAAIMAPSGGNSQPWKWKYKGNKLYLFLNHLYHTKLIDFNNSASFIALGAAIENLQLKANELGYEVILNRFPIGKESKLIAYCSFRKRNDVSQMVGREISNLSEAIPFRGTNRKLVPRKYLNDSILTDLQVIAKTIKGAELKFLSKEEDLLQIGDIIAKADRIRIMHQGGHTDYRAEMVWNKEDAQLTRRGLEVDLLDLTPSERVGFKISREWGVINLLNEWKGGSALEKYSRKTAASAAAIGLIVMPEFSPESLFEGGRAIERVWLAATLKNIALQPLSISTFLMNRLTYEGPKMYSEQEVQELTAMKFELEKLFELNGNEGKVIMFRIFDGGKLEKRSLRVPVENVLYLS